MRKLLLAVAAVVGLGLLSAPAELQQKGGEGDETGPYDVVDKWPQPFARPGYIQGSQGGVFAESANRIFMANRGEPKLPDKLPNNFNGAWGSLGSQATGQKPELRNCIVIVDANGKLIESWTQWDKLFEGGRGPHAVKISPYDPERAVWVVDDMRQQIFKFTNDGKKLLLTLGEAGVGAARPGVGRLDGPEELLLEPVGRVVIELLVGIAEQCQRGARAVGGLGDGVEQLAPGLGGDVGHDRRSTAPRGCGRARAGTLATWSCVKASTSSSRAIRAGGRSSASISRRW